MSDHVATALQLGAQIDAVRAEALQRISALAARRGAELAAAVALDGWTAVAREAGISRSRLGQILAEHRARVADGAAPHAEA